LTSPSLQYPQAIEDFAKSFAENANFELGQSAESEYVRVCVAYGERLLRAGLPIIFDNQNLSKLVGYSEEYLNGAKYCTDKFYRRFSVPKRGGGSRMISEPLPSLKEVQRWIYNKILLQVPVSDAAKAYVPGKKLKESARLHRSQGFVLRVDIKDFFPTISRYRVFGLFRSLGYCSEVAGSLSHLCCLDESLPQGSPCSPYLSNIILRSLDKRMLSYCRSRGLRYSRYADDFSISGRSFSHSLIALVCEMIRSEGFDVNEKKTAIMRAGGRQIVVGAVVNQKINAHREYRRKLRQDFYYVNKHGLDSHLAHIGEFRSGARQYYLGKCSFVLSLNAADRDASAFSELLSK